MSYQLPLDNYQWLPNNQPASPSSYIHNNHQLQQLQQPPNHPALLPYLRGQRMIWCRVCRAFYPWKTYWHVRNGRLEAPASTRRFEDLVPCGTCNGFFPPETFLHVNPAALLPINGHVGSLHLVQEEEQEKEEKDEGEGEGEGDEEDHDWRSLSSCTSEPWCPRPPATDGAVVERWRALCSRPPEPVVERLPVWKAGQVADGEGAPAGAEEGDATDVDGDDEGIDGDALDDESDDGSIPSFYNTPKSGCRCWIEEDDELDERGRVVRRFKCRCYDGLPGSGGAPAGDKEDGRLTRMKEDGTLMKMRGGG